jgi:hypothetical protein
MSFKSSIYFLSSFSISSKIANNSDWILKFEVLSSLKNDKRDNMSRSEATMKAQYLQWMANECLTCNATSHL